MNEANGGLRLLQSCSLIAFCNRIYHPSNPRANDKFLQVYQKNKRKSAIAPGKRGRTDASAAAKCGGGRPDGQGGVKSHVALAQQLATGWELFAGVKQGLETVHWLLRGAGGAGERT